MWQDAVDYATYVYDVTSKKPRFEKKGLCDRPLSVVVSIISNIAKGVARFSDEEFSHFLDLALGSSFEVESLLLKAKNVGYLEDAQYQEPLLKLAPKSHQLSVLISTIEQNKDYTLYYIELRYMA